MEKFLKKICLFLINYKIFRFIFFSINNSVDNYFITSKKTGLLFFCKNYLIKYRIDTLLSKEKETIEWIKNFNKDDIFFDIGANIGLYSCYAAQKGIRTFSFEPSCLNLEILVKNININNFEDIITVSPIALSDKTKYSSFNISDNTIGGALSTFAENFTYDGSKIKTALKYKTFGMSLDDCIKKFNLPQPDHLKIDVDGTEHLILQGSKETLENCSSILVEVNENFYQQKYQVESILKSNNFKNISNQKIILENSSTNCFNQIWMKQK